MLRIGRLWAECRQGVLAVPWTHGDPRQGCGRTGGALFQEGKCRILGASFRGDLGEDLGVQDRDRGLGTQAAVTLDLANRIGERPAFHDEAVDAHPCRRAVHAGVTVHEDRPGLRVS